LGEGGETEAGLAGAGGSEVEELALGALLRFLVEFCLGGCEFAPNRLLELGGEFGGDGLFRATENVGRGLRAETLVEPRAILAADARRKFVEVAGHEELEERAEIVEGVFERCAGEQKTTGRAEGAEGLGVLGAAVFDVLGFVGDHAGEFDGREKRAVAGERAVARDDEIVAEEVGGGSEAAFAVVEEDAEMRDEAYGLAAPILDEGGGADDEAGASCAIES
jgi:hypothetical protein